jgi:hypothetical protein
MTAHALGGRDEIMIFVRATHFYPIQGVLGVDLKKQAADHAELNPGTVRVEDLEGNVLWRPQ